MDVLRQRLPWLAGAWLCCQLALLTAAPVSLCTGRTAAADAVTCTCVHTGHDACPMHHPAKSPSGCNCRSNAPDPGSLTVVSLFGPAAVLADAPARVAPPAISRLLSYPINRFTGLVPAPDGPPPRA